MHDEEVDDCAPAVQMVEDCIRCSMEAAYARLQLAAEAAEAPKEERLTALARGVDGLLDEVEGTFAPALSAYVLDAAGVAAASLNRLFGAALRPWMSTGERPAPWLEFPSSKSPLVFCLFISKKVQLGVATMAQSMSPEGALHISK